MLCCALNMALSQCQKRVTHWATEQACTVSLSMFYLGPLEHIESTLACTMDSLLQYKVIDVNYYKGVYVVDATAFHHI